MDKKRVKSLNTSPNVDVLVSVNASSLFPDDSLEFHDPYSDLNLFLAKKIKEEMKDPSYKKKWSTFLQEKFLDKITPEFQKQFPNYRLGMATIKKVWEKIAYFSQILEAQKGALTQEGYLDVGFLIRENLKLFLFEKRNSLHPYLLAQQLALKVSECCATYEGTRLVIEPIIKRIWSVQRHLLSPKLIASSPSSYEMVDKWDRWIIKTMLESIEKRGELSQKELKEEVHHVWKTFHRLTTHASFVDIYSHIAFSLADKLYSYLPFHCNCNLEQQCALFAFLRCYADAAVPQEELFFEVRKAYALAYQKEKKVPFLPEGDLEVILWKILGENKHPSSFPFAQQLEEEIGNLWVVQPNHDFNTLVKGVVQFFKRIKEVISTASLVEIEGKIEFWTSQGDLVYRYLKIEENHLMSFMMQVRNENSLTIQKLYLEKYPFLTPFSHSLKIRIQLLRKYFWYSLLSQPEQPTIERLFQWYFQSIHIKDKEELIAKLEEICKARFPLLPFDYKYVEKLFSQQQEYSEEQKREA